MRGMAADVESRVALQLYQPAEVVEVAVGDHSDPDVLGSEAETLHLGGHEARVRRHPCVDQADAVGGLDEIGVRPQAANAVDPHV